MKIRRIDEALSWAQLSNDLQNKWLSAGLTKQDFENYRAGKDGGKPFGSREEVRRYLDSYNKEKSNNNSSNNYKYTSLFSAQEDYDEAVKKYMNVSGRTSNNGKVTKKGIYKKEYLLEADAAVAGAINLIVNNGGIEDSPGLELRMNPGFLSRWIQKMKWEELRDPENNFVHTLKKPGAKELLKSKENFVKVYNAYTGNQYDADKFKNVSGIISAVNEKKQVKSGEAAKLVKEIINNFQNSGNKDDQAVVNTLIKTFNKK